MEDMPAVSVVIPLYNKEPHIARALNSVLNQTHQDFEIIVIDDGSTDEGAEVVRGFRDPRIQLIQQENKGVSAARNLGIEAARAELIAFLDADDEWLPSFIKAILRLKALYPDAGLYGTAYEFNFSGSIVQKVYDEDGGERLLSSYFGAIVEFGSLIFNSSSFASTREVLMGVGGYPVNVKWSEDSTLWGKIALRYPVAYSPEVCSIYHQYTVNNNTGITEYMENEFLQYLSTIDGDELLKFNCIEDLMEYCDLCRIAAISRNIFSGHGARARTELQFVKSPHYTGIKYKLQFSSYIPLQLLKTSSSIMQRTRLFITSRTGRVLL